MVKYLQYYIENTLEVKQETHINIIMNRIFLVLCHIFAIKWMFFEFVSIKKSFRTCFHKLILCL